MVMIKKLTSSLTKLFTPEYVLLWILFLMIVGFSIASPVFRRPDNLMDIVRASATNALMVLGLTWIVATGEIDITFPDIAALASMVTAYGVFNGWSWGVSVLIAILACSLYGLLSGFLVNKFLFRSLIATIGVSVLAKSTAYIIGSGSPIYLLKISPTIQAIVYGKIGGVVPFLMVLVIVLYILASILQNYTKLGQYLYAMGENRKASFEAGIPEKTILYSLFILSAGLASFAGILQLALYSSGQPNFQGSYFVDGLTAVFLGALVIKLGKPNVIGTFIGAIFIIVLSNGLTLLNIPFFYGLIIKGFLMIVGVTVIALTKSQFYASIKTRRLRQVAAAGD